MDAAHNRLAKLRTAAGLSQEAMAERLGMSQPNYQRIEAGSQPLRVDVAQRIAVILGLPAERVLFGGPNELPIEEEELLTRFRRLAERERNAVMALLRSLT